MSVNVHDQKPTEFNVTIKALALCKYTFGICQNKNTFPPEADFDGTVVAKCVDLAIEIYLCCYRANDCNVRKGNPSFRKNLEERVELQEKAIKLCTDMLAYITLAQKLFKFRAKRLKYWSGQISNIREMVVAWKESDIKRFRAV